MSAQRPSASKETRIPWRSRTVGNLSERLPGNSRDLARPYVNYVLALYYRPPEDSIAKQVEICASTHPAFEHSRNYVESGRGDANVSPVLTTELSRRFERHDGVGEKSPVLGRHAQSAGLGTPEVGGLRRAPRTIDAYAGACRYLEMRERGDPLTPGRMSASMCGR